MIYKMRFTTYVVVVVVVFSSENGDSTALHHKGGSLTHESHAIQHGRGRQRAKRLRPTLSAVCWGHG